MSHNSSRHNPRYAGVLNRFPIFTVNIELGREIVYAMSKEVPEYAPGIVKTGK
jgi:hypothetical protein